jgi:hypothetical protein
MKNTRSTWKSEKKGMVVGLRRRRRHWIISGRWWAMTWLTLHIVKEKTSKEYKHFFFADDVSSNLLFLSLHNHLRYITLHLHNLLLFCFGLLDFWLVFNLFLPLLYVSLQPFCFLLRATCTIFFLILFIFVKFHWLFIDYYFCKH